MAGHRGWTGRVGRPGWSDLADHFDLADRYRRGLTAPAAPRCVGEGGSPRPLDPFFPRGDPFQGGVHCHARHRGRGDRVRCRRDPGLPYPVRPSPPPGVPESLPR